MWMSSLSRHTSAHGSFLMTLLFPRPKRDSLLYVARPTAVTQTWDTSLCWAQCPGISVSRIEPSGVVSRSRFSTSSSRSLGHRLLLGQRSRINLFSHDIGSLLHQDHSNSRTELTGHCDNGDSRSQVPCMGAANRTIKISELAVLADRRPRRLDELTAQPSISGVSDRPPTGSIPGGVFGRHQSQKPCQLTNVFDLSPVADASQKLAGHNPADPTDRHHVLDALGQLWIVTTKTMDLSGALHHFLLKELQAVEQLIELKADRLRTFDLLKLTLSLSKTIGCLRERRENQSPQRATAI